MFQTKVVREIFPRRACSLPHYLDRREELPEDYIALTPLGVTHRQDHQKNLHPKPKSISFDVILIFVTLKYRNIQSIKHNIEF